jgi:hypothetical protein
MLFIYSPTFYAHDLWHGNSVTLVYDFVDDLRPIFDNDLITLFVEFALKYKAAICIYRYGYYLDFTLMHVGHGKALLPISIAPCIRHA